MDKPKLFIGCAIAHLKTARKVELALRDVVKPTVWDKEPWLSKGVLEALVSSLGKWDFAVLLFTPDELSRRGKNDLWRTSPNVMVEFGLFVGSLGRDRTFVLRDPTVPLPADAQIITEEITLASGAYDVAKGCETIKAHIRALSRRFPPERELGVLYRLVNACTWPHYEDVHARALLDAEKKFAFHFPRRESFESLTDVVGFLVHLLTDYVYPQLGLEQLDSLRIYLAYFLGDGVSSAGESDRPDLKTTACLDVNDSGKGVSGQFVIGMSNLPERSGSAPRRGENGWRLGRAIEGFSHDQPRSVCARVFATGTPDGFPDATQIPAGASNYATKDELSVHTYPVEWRSAEGKASVGVLTISSKKAGRIGPAWREVVELVAQVLGFLISLYGAKHRADLEAEGAKGGEETLGSMIGVKVDEDERGRHFLMAVRGIRRRIASHFENELIELGKHEWTDRTLRCSRGRRPDSGYAGPGVPSATTGTWKGGAGEPPGCC